MSYDRGIPPMPISARMRFLSQSLSFTAAGSAVAFACLAALHGMLAWPSVQRLDHGLLQSLHANTSPVLTVVMLTLSWIGAIKFFAPALTLWIGYLAACDRRREAATLACATVGAFLLNEIFKLHFHRPRPGLPWSIGDEHTFSFPSGHSLFAVVLYGTLAWLALRRGQRWPLALAVAMPLAIGTSRIYLGMHYPTDVLGGYIVGLIWLGTVVAIVRVPHDRQSEATPIVGLGPGQGHTPR